MVSPVILAGLGTSLAINLCRTLKSLVLDITFIGHDYDPLCGLSRELRFITANHILEELKLCVWVEDVTSFQAASEDWSAFDSVLAESGAFPMLHRVLVVFRIYEPHHGELKERNVPATRRKQSGGV